MSRWAELGPTWLTLWRSLCGGHWERWWVDSPVNDYVWHHVPACSTLTRTRPTGLCRGVPLCETYR